MRANLLGCLALFIGASTLTLGILAEKERDHLQEQYEKRLADEKADSMVSVSIKSVTFEFGKTSEPKRAPVPPPQIARLWFVALASGMMGLVVAPLAWVKEKQPILPVSAISLCAVGLLWHYVVVGITIAVVIIVLAALCSSFG